MRIAVVTTGRFWVLDLARELTSLGHDVRFYSYVPRRRSEQFGLARACHRGLLGFVWPLVLAQRMGPRAWGLHLDRLLQDAIDRLACRLLEPCDIFIGMSGVCVNSARAARQKFGARVILERGSRHILSQKEILEAIPEIEKPAVPEFNVRRELWGYEFADVMSIPSRHVEQSFVDRGYPREKLFRNPYGVDLTMFPPTPKPQNQIPTIVFAGEWSLRKGCDLLMKALEGQSWRVIHVGARGDAPAPKTANFESRGFVQQSRLAEIYGIADVAVLPSREDGFGLVLAQALACGLPLACTDRTGGEDLSESVDSSWITVVQANNVTALRAGIRQALGKAATQCGVRDIVGSCGERLSWRAYGRRYSDALEKIKAREFSL